ncbi:unnamed protein product [Cladocopium goreaui]|uniref:Peptidyl-prolyl cis-trans isomerase D n=1 Tax=Cladocopium goreaui TaxID=2562237 RepID=A0A9P1CMK6_9DINO|nr:unnamed protein product [Cladocopium goreaui]
MLAGSAPTVFAQGSSRFFRATKQSVLSESVPCHQGLRCSSRAGHNVKALHRRAESRIRPVKSTAYDHDLAIKELAQENRPDPSNQTVEHLLVRLRSERSVQREKDVKTFTGMFDRGQIYDKVLQEAKAAAASSKGGSLISSGVPCAAARHIEIRRWIE